MREVDATFEVADALYPHMTVHQNMAFVLKLRNEPKPEIERREREAAAILDIGQILHSTPRRLAGGQRQRVSVPAPPTRTA